MGLGQVASSQLILCAEKIRSAGCPSPPSSLLPPPSPRMFVAPPVVCYLPNPQTQTVLTCVEKHRYLHNAYSVRHLALSGRLPEADFARNEDAHLFFPIRLVIVLSRREKVKTEDREREKMVYPLIPSVVSVFNENYNSY